MSLKFRFILGSMVCCGLLSSIFPLRVHKNSTTYSWRHLRFDKIQYMVFVHTSVYLFTIYSTYIEHLRHIKCSVLLKFISNLLKNTYTIILILCTRKLKLREINKVARDSYQVPFCVFLCEVGTCCLLNVGPSPNQHWAGPRIAEGLAWGCTNRLVAGNLTSLRFGSY